jgi:hypothetical protein
MVVRPIRYLNADDPGAVAATGAPVYVPGGPTTAFVSV